MGNNRTTKQPTPPTIGSGPDAAIDALIVRFQRRNERFRAAGSRGRLLLDISLRAQAAILVTDWLLLGIDVAALMPTYLGGTDRLLLLSVGRGQPLLRFLLLPWFSVDAWFSAEATPNAGQSAPLAIGALVGVTFTFGSSPGS